MSELEVLKAELLDTPKAKADYRRKVLAMRLGEQVRQLRDAAGISQEELARRIGTKQPGIARLERGSGMPTLDMLDRVAAALGVELLVAFRSPGRTSLVKPKKTTSTGATFRVPRSAAAAKKGAAAAKKTVAAAAEKIATPVKKSAAQKSGRSSGTSRRRGQPASWRDEPDALLGGT